MTEDIFQCARLREFSDCLQIYCIWKALISLSFSRSLCRFQGSICAAGQLTLSETSTQGHQGSRSTPNSPPGRRCTDPDKAALLWAAQRHCCAPVPGAMMLWLRPCVHAGTRGRGGKRGQSWGGYANTSGICRKKKTLNTTPISCEKSMHHTGRQSRLRPLWRCRRSVIFKKEIKTWELFTSQITLKNFTTGNTGNAVRELSWRGSEAQQSH